MGRVDPFMLQAGDTVQSQKGLRHVYDVVSSDENTVTLQCRDTRTLLTFLRSALSNPHVWRMWEGDPEAEEHAGEDAYNEYAEARLGLPTGDDWTPEIYEAEAGASEQQRQDFLAAVRKIVQKDNANMQQKPDDSTTAPTRGQILGQAIDITLGDRNEAYGPPRQNHERIAAMWNAYLSIRVAPGAGVLTPEDVAQLMTLLKIARTLEGFREDNYIDAAAYIAIAGEIAKEDASD